MSASISVRTEVCTGCGLCVPACPFGSIAMVDGLAVIDETCTLCGACESSCPYEAIVLRKTDAVKADTDAFSGVLVIAEQRDGAVDHSTLELLGEGSRLAAAEGTGVSVVLLTGDTGDWPEVLIHQGADTVYVAEDPGLAHYRTEPSTRLISALILEMKPSVVLASATTTGRDLMPRIASNLCTGLTADCTVLELDEESGLLLQTRPAFGGNIMATIVCERTRPQMATVRPRVMKALELDSSRTGKIVRLPIQQKDIESRTEIVEFIPLDEGEVDITEAEAIVSGGRGLKEPGNFALMAELAELLGGSVGASRAAIDAGWISYPHQVGQTGKTVQPRIYIACGISGAVQHRVGMQSSDRIVAVNRDESAPIFDFCDLGCVGDLFEVIPALIREIKRRRS